jgi:hypothetical protein
MPIPNPDVRAGVEVAVDVEIGVEGPAPAVCGWSRTTCTDRGEVDNAGEGSGEAYVRILAAEADETMDDARDRETGG